jgi:nitrite reductase/ring-hydroxylating ferredoxin subunit
LDARLVEGTQRERFSRRLFLVRLAKGSLAAAGALVLGQIVRFLSYQPADEGAAVFTLGQASDFRIGTLKYVAQAQAYIGRDLEGFYAVDAVCSHLGCLVEIGKNDTFVCPCHGSAFTADGKAKKGPATRPLRHLQLSLDEDENLVLDRRRAVQPSTRLSH